MHGFPYKDIVSQYRKWLQRLNQNSVYDPTEDLRQRINEAEDFIGCRHISTEIDRLGALYSRVGVGQILDEGAVGWNTLRLSACVRFWATRIRCKTIDLDLDKTNLEVVAPNIVRTGVACLFCIALKLDDEAEWLSDRLEQGRLDGSVAGWEDWNHPTPRLAIALRRFRTGSRRDDLVDLNLGVYQAIFENWNSVEGLKEPLLAAADYHLKNIRSGPNGISEFEVAPFDLLPVEILAIQRTRDLLGLETPKIDHSLTNTPFGKPPDQFELIRDELLEAAIAKVRQIMPEV